MKRNIAESAIERETDTKNRIKAVSNLGWFISPDINRNVPTT